MINIERVMKKCLKRVMLRAGVSKLRAGKYYLAVGVNSGAVKLRVNVAK